MRVCISNIIENFSLNKMHVVRHSSGFSHIAHVINEYVIVTSHSFIQIEKCTLLKQISIRQHLVTDLII